MILEDNRCKNMGMHEASGPKQDSEGENTGEALEIPTSPKRNPRSHEYHTKELFQRCKEKG